MTTIKYLMLFVLHGFAYCSNAQSTAPCLEIDSIQTEYAIGDDITFIISNYCDEKVHISISLERRENDRWIVFAEDIFQIPSIFKEENTIFLNENESFQIPSISKVENAIFLNENEINRKERWKIKRTIYRKGCDNTYRFRYNIRKTNQELIITEYSNVFHVKDVDIMCRMGGVSKEGGEMIRFSSYSPE